MVENIEESNQNDLIFFDTFSHDIHEKLNLDLVQFRSPVYISEIRIIPLGARVQADFPGGGNRLGATNPSQFDIEFFVNDLSVNVASTFEPLGKFSYNQNECINLECRNNEIRKIPTDGLVLKGCYTTITLAVYGNIITCGTMQNIPNQGNNVDTAHVSSNEETNESDNGEIYNNNARKIRHSEDQNSSCDPTVSSTIADDLKDGDQIINTSPMNIYSRSPSKEQDLQKSKREWSNSPDESYQHKRPRVSGSYENRRKPRTPPLQSPRISRPDSDDEDESIKKNRLIENEYSGDLSTTYCPSSPSMANNTPIESPTDIYDEPVELEPIESDEDIIDDVNGIEDLTDEMFAEEFPIKTFNPFVDNLRVVEKPPKDAAKIAKFLDEMTKLCENYEDLFGSEQEVGNESWLTVCEQILHTLHSASEFLEMLTDEMMATIAKCIKIGLSYSLSIKYNQAGCNLRHLKTGIRLVECLAANGRFLSWLIVEQKFNVFQSLFELFPLHLIPMPVKLMVARVLYKLIDSKEGIEKFIEHNGYRYTISIFTSITDIRLLYTLKSVLKKMHAFETLEKVRQLAIEIFKEKSTGDTESEKSREMEKLFASLIDAHQRDVLQTRKFVPIGSQFEIFSKIKTPNFISFYKTHNFMESLLLLLSAKNSISSQLTLQIFKYLQLMMSNAKDFEYMTSNMTILNSLVKILLESPNADESCDNVEIALEIAFKTETKFILDSILQCSDELEIAEYLNSLYHLCVGSGKKHVLEYIAKEENLCIFLNLIDKEKKVGKVLGSPGFKHKSPVLSYSIDIVDFIVRNAENLDYLKKYGNVLINLVKHHDSFEPSVAAILQEMSIFLKPLDIEKLFNYDDISPLIETIKRSMEFLTNFPGDLIMTLRILRYMIVDDESFKSDYRELKSDFYTIALYHTTDGAATLFSVLDKLVTHFDQPMVHSYLFGANQGELLMKTIRPIIQVLRKLLVKTIEAMNVNFKDVTSIETILKTYTLMHSIHPSCKTYKEAKEIQEEIVKMLLAYTQPSPPDGLTTINIHKSLWTQMIGEIIKYTLNGPYRFISGLTVLSELLPLPLPIPIQGNELNKLEVQRLITERQLWSAHLHPQSQLIMEMIQSFCVSSSTELFAALHKVSVQLSDLAPNMTLLVSRSVVDLILVEAADKNNEGTAILVRLLKFLASISRHACVKVSVLSILGGKLAEVMSQLLRITNDASNDHVMAQFYVLTLLQNLFECEITMLANSNQSPELILASGLPFKELIQQFIDDVVDIFVKTSNDHLTFAAFRTILLFVDHDVTIKFLKAAILSKEDKILEKFNAIAEKCKNDRKHTLIIPDIIEFLKSLIHIEASEESSLIPPRTITLSINELAKILKWNSEEYRNGNCVHFLQIFAALVNEQPKVEGEESEDNLKSDLEAFIQQLQQTTASTQEVTSAASSDDECNLLQAEGIVTQFHSRIPFCVAFNLEELPMDFWITNFCDEHDMQVTDQVQYDLNELVSECLPPDTNISSDCKRLFALSSSPQSSKDKSQTGLCFRTRRVEVSDPISGRPEKKIFPKFPPRGGRGFSRVAIRGDIFRSRPPNTSRPPSLHVDDFVAMESGAQSTYSKREIISAPRGRGRGGFRGRGSSYSPSMRGHSTFPPRGFRGRVLRSRGRGYPR